MILIDFTSRKLVSWCHVSWRVICGVLRTLEKLIGVITDTVMSHDQEYRIFVYLSIPSADYRDENTRDNTFDKVIKTIDTKTKSVGMIIVMPTRIVANVNLIPCPRTAPARDSQSWPKRTCHKRNGLRLVKHLRQFVASVIAVTQIEFSLFTPRVSAVLTLGRVRGPGLGGLHDMQHLQHCSMIPARFMESQRFFVLSPWLLADY